MPLIHARKAATNANWNKMGRLGKAKKKMEALLIKGGASLHITGTSKST